MMQLIGKFCRALSHSRALPLAISLAAVSPGAASAHVKWFSNFDVSSQPRVLEKVVSVDFVALSAVAVAVLLAGCVLDRTVLGEAVARALDRVTVAVRANGDTLLRATCAFLCIALWTIGGTLLTPELKTTAEWVPQLQLAMAVSLLFRRTACFAGLGIIILYGTAVRAYGIFHLLDYPVFLGVALYLIVRSLPDSTRLPFRSLDLLRGSAAITLMWASVEKWAYPEWTMPIYLGHPAMSLGFDFDLFMQAAGVIEFTLAFALLWTPLVRRSSAFILLGTFISATAEFGKIDVIGHSVIVAVLLILGSDNARAAPARQPWRWVATPTLAYAVALATFLSVYYGIHAALFGTAII